MNEIWKDIKGYEGIYQVSNLGNVRSLDRYVPHWRGGKRLIKGKVKKITRHKVSDRSKHYAVVTLSNGSDKLFYIHRLVYESFIGDIKNGLVIDHIDNNQDNNSVNNLQMITQYENCIKNPGSGNRSNHDYPHKNGFSKNNG